MMEYLLNILRKYQNASNTVDCHDPPSVRHGLSEMIENSCEQTTQWCKFLHVETSSAREVVQHLPN